ncbi:MAG TPA: hypothetical protein VGA08_03365 [Candidatus Saccharimonadales bacterium]
MFIGHAADLLILVGEVIIAYAVIAVHDRMREEHSVDNAVYNTMLRERRMVIFGVILLFIGFTLRIIERILS